MAEDVPRTTWNQWIWPVPAMQGNVPVVSGGYGRAARGGRGHFGVDIMHRRRGDPRDIGTPGPENFTTYPGEQVYAAGDGVIERIGETSTGKAVRLIHRVDGVPMLTAYRHLASLDPSLKVGLQIPAGWPLGVMGDDPSNPNDPVHLHFELWDTSLAKVYPDSTIDPAPFMARWGVIVQPGGRIIRPTNLPTTKPTRIPFAVSETAPNAEVFYVLGGLLIALAAARSR